MQRQAGIFVNIDVRVGLDLAGFGVRLGGLAVLIFFSGTPVVSFIAGACVLGVQSGINVCGALVYPTSLRALGSGWQLGIGRLGSIVGPLVGALFVALPVDRLYMWSALPFLLGAVICYTVHRLNQERMRSRPWLGQMQAAR